MPFLLGALPTFAVRKAFRAVVRIRPAPPGPDPEARSRALLPSTVAHQSQLKAAKREFSSSVSFKAWAWISWIQGSSFLVGLGHFLFQLRQL